MTRIDLRPAPWRKNVSRPVDADRTFVAKSPPVFRIVGWFVIWFSAFLGIGWLVKVDADLGPDLLMYSITLAFFCLGVACIVLSGSIEMDSHSVRYKAPWAHYSMRWDEVERIEAESDDPDPRYQALGKMALVFVGENKRLSILGPGYWHGRDRAQMFRLLEAQIEERGIEVRKSRAALWKLPKNTKVPKVSRTRGADGRR